LFIAITGTALAATVSPRPNIVVITDDQGYGDLSAHGNPVLKTPALDGLHAESVRLAVVRLLRAHYEQWWTRVEPELHEPVRIVVGSPKENPSRLTSMDWYARGLMEAAQPFDVRLAGQTVVVEGSLPGGRPQPAMNGPWNLEVEQSGRYRIALRRWPVEADAPIRASLPPYLGVDGTIPGGIALPVVTARMKIGGTDLSKKVADEDKEAVFEVTLPAGPTQLQTWFLEADGKETCGVFYVEVRRS